MSENIQEIQSEKKIAPLEGSPTKAFIGASWGSLLIGASAYLIGLYNANMQLNEKGYYFAVLTFGLYSAISLQKTVRDKNEGIPVTGIYYGISWFALITALTLMSVGLWNARSIVLSEKGFYGMSFILCLYSSVAIQKNIRDSKAANEKYNDKK